MPSRPQTSDLPETPSPGIGACAPDRVGVDGTAPHPAAWDTISGHEKRLLGAVPSLTLQQVAQEAGTGVELARRFWRAMGFADAQPDAVRFTEADVEALRALAEVVGLGGQASQDGSGCVGGQGAVGGLATSSALEMLRAQSYTMDRLVLWQLETLVSDVAQRYDLDDTSARLVALDRIEELLEPLRTQLDYVWRRHLTALLSRTESEVAKRGKEEAGPDLYPLTRSLGFVDIVSFTQRAQTMGRTELETMLTDFENTARDVVTSRGARVVKTIGDAVMYIADDVTTAAGVVTALVEELQRGPEMIRVRASLVQGRVVSRSGDVFGPPVNLASRLVDTAEPGGIRMDEPTARAIMRGPQAQRYVVRECHELVAKGLGNIVPWSLERAGGGRCRPCGRLATGSVPPLRGS